MKHVFRIFSIIILTLAASCSDKETFVIKGDITGGKDLTLRLVMRTPQGVKTEMIATRGAHFEYGTAAPADGAETIIEIYSNDYTLLGLMTAARGTEASITVDPAGIKGFRANGTAFNTDLSSWLGSVKTVDNPTIEAYVKRNPGNPVAGVLMASLYDAYADPAAARALYMTLEPRARPAYYATGFEQLIRDVNSAAGSKLESASVLCSADTIAFLRPTAYRATFVAFTADEPAHRDSVVPALKRLKGTKGLVVEHSLATDTVTWRRQTRTDSCTWTSVWTGPGTAAEGARRFAISRLPYYVVADSTGQILYEGTQLHKAETTFNKCL